MTADGTNCYHYNEANQLDKVTNCTNSQTIAEYTYDYFGNRMVKKVYTLGTLSYTTTSWTDAFETKVINGGGTENTSYYFANDQLIAKKDKDGNKTYFSNDHLGSTSLITNQAGSLVENTTYDPWGEIKSGGTKSKFLYTGQEKDSETNLNYYGARYYDSHIRRFTQPDDVIQNIYNPQGLNRYSYVWNNPLRYTDPSGRVVTCNAGGCSSSITALNNQPKKTTPTTYSSFVAAVSKPSTPAKTSVSSGSSGGGISSGGSGGNAAVVAAGSVIRQNQINGANFERTVLNSLGAPKNIQMLRDYGNRIPDILDEEKGIIGECKAVGYICLTSQLKDMIQYAGDKGYKFTLYPKAGGTWSQPVEDAINNLEYAGTGATGAILPYAASAGVSIIETPFFFVNPSLISPNNINNAGASKL